MKRTGTLRARALGTRAIDRLVHRTHATRPRVWCARECRCAMRTARRHLLHTTSCRGERKESVCRAHARRSWRPLRVISVTGSWSVNESHKVIAPRGRAVWLRPGWLGGCISYHLISPSNLKTGLRGLSLDGRPPRPRHGPRAPTRRPRHLGFTFFAFGRAGGGES